MTAPHVAILGGGPAGVGAAYQLRRRARADVTLFEQRCVVGGNAGSFFHEGQYLDYGSHRLHHACDPEILEDIRKLLDGDLLHRVRHGRIRLRGRWLHFPLQPLDLVLHLDRPFALSAIGDRLRRSRVRSGSSGETFASVMVERLGPTICEHFYFPYARKIWGREPEELSPIQARKRVSAGTFAKLIGRVFGSRGRYFYYPRRGYGQISEAYATAAERLGTRLQLGWRVRRLVQPNSEGGRWLVEAQRNSDVVEIAADHIWSTIPITVLTRIVEPAPPAPVVEAARSIEYRAMVLVYLQLETDRFSPTDAHYFPEENVSMTRLSEPKNYSGAAEPRGRTTLCAEIPCEPDDEVWRSDEEELGERVVKDLACAELPLPGPISGVLVRRLRHAYPIYRVGYEKHFDLLDRWAETLPRFLSYGRQGLFAHDNTHHALYMAYAAVDCLQGHDFDRNRWADYREIFRGHVVED
ncbi:MAG: protoporphyrinogen/coproporphyrinogen oxidase [Gemmatimonadota bacterium]